MAKAPLRFPVTLRLRRHVTVQLKELTGRTGDLNGLTVDGLRYILQLRINLDVVATGYSGEVCADLRECTCFLYLHTCLLCVQRDNTVCSIAFYRSNGGGTEIMNRVLSLRSSVAASAFSVIGAFTKMN